MEAFIGKDTAGVFGWHADTIGKVRINASSYAFSLHQFSQPEDSGTWANTDEYTYFNSFASTTLTVIPTDSVDSFQTNVFIVFKDVNSVVKMPYSSNLKYTFVPVSLNFVVVAVGVKGGKLYSWFSSPMILTGTFTTNFTLSQTTTADFKNQLNALN